MKVLVKRVNEETEVKEIELNLETLHELVDGYIEAIYLNKTLSNKGIFAYGNDNAKIEHKRCNFWLYKKQDVCCGDVVFLKDDGNGNEIGLTDDDIELIKQFLKKAEITENEKLVINSLIMSDFF